MNSNFRTENDSMGSMQVRANVYYGAQTARAVENFPISTLRFPRSFIRALGLIKEHAAKTNAKLGLLPPKIADAIQQAAREVAEGRFDDQFVVDVFQTGSGTSTNMNANEVIANRASEILGGKLGDRTVHPNDHVNHGQSSNDVIPTAIHVSVLDGFTHSLIPALEKLENALREKAAQFADVLKIGRTHLQDATPIRLGQEFGGYAAQVEQAIGRLTRASEGLGSLALGGTAVGTGINTHPEFARRTIARLAQQTGLALKETDNHFAAQAAIDSSVEAVSALKGAALALFKIANDIRWLASGPRCGLGELKLPATQPGSSIMPGKVNPVMPEMLIQVAAQVVGAEATVAFAATCGAFELNTMLPVVAFNLLQSIELLSKGSEVFARRCIAGLEADVEKCRSNIEQSLAMCTALVPALGYDQAAKIAKIAYETKRTVREVAIEKTNLGAKEIERLLDPARQTEPGAEVGGAGG